MRSRPGRRRPRVLLALVSVLYGVAQLVLVSPNLGIGWDETVYVSQVSPQAPPAVFSAPRARGVPLLVAPVVVLTDSVLVLRLYLTVVSSAALFGAFAVWLRIRDDHVVPLAALLFGSCWLSLFYGDQAMPDLYVALAAVAAAGLVVLAERSRTAPVGLAVTLAVMSLMRPSDALVAAVALAAGALAILRRRRIAALAALAAGLAVGWGQWAVEAQARFGGLLARLREAGEHNATGWSLTIAEHARALDGPSLCRYGADCGPVSPVAVIWWLAIPAMTVLGLWSARRGPHLAPLLLATGTAVAMALPYLFYVDYAAPRFLMPVYALLSLPVAQAAAAGLRLGHPPAAAGPRLGHPPAAAGLRLGHPPAAAGPRLGRTVAVAVAAGLLAHLALQGAIAYGLAAAGRHDRAEIGRATAELRRLGVRPPCMVYGQSGVQIGYLLGCDSQGIIQRFAEQAPARVRQALRNGAQVVAVHKDVRLPPYMTAWDETDLPGPWSARFARR